MTEKQRFEEFLLLWDSFKHDEFHPVTIYIRKYLKKILSDNRKRVAATLDLKWVKN